MNIGVLSGSIISTPPSKYGGIEREAWWLSTALADLGHKVTLFAKKGSQCPPGGELVAVEGSELEYPPLFKAKMADLDAAIDMTHDKVVPRAFPDFPIVCTYQVMTISWPRNVVCISRAQRRHLKLTWNVPVIYYGLDADAYPLYGGPRSDYLLYMGSVIAEKSVTVAIDVAESMGVPLKMCGPRWQPSYFDNAITPRLNDQIQYIGDVGGEQKLDLIQKARVLLHPVGVGTAWIEAGAIIVFEALHCGTPVVCSDNGCLPEYIKQGVNGFICHTIGEYVEAVKQCDDLDPQVCRHSVRHLRKERMAREYTDLLREMLGPAGRRW